MKKIKTKNSTGDEVKKTSSLRSASLCSARAGDEDKSSSSLLASARIREFFIDIFRNNKKEFVVIIAIATFGSLLTVFIPYLYGRIFDLVFVPQTTIVFLLSLIGIWAFLSLISNFISAKTSELGEILGAKTSLETEVDAYGHFLTLPISFHKRRKTGETLEKISRGSWNLEQFIRMVSDILPSMLFLLFALLIMLIVQWQLGLIAVFTFIIYSILTLRFVKPLIKSQEKVHDIYEKEYGSVYDKLYNIFLIKNFTLEKVGKKGFYKSFMKRAFPASKDSAKKAAILQHIQGIVYSLSFVAMLGTAIFLLKDNQITHGQFIMFFGYISLFFKPFSMLGQIYNFYKRASVAIGRIIKLKEIVPESVKYGNKMIEEFNGEIEFKEVCFNYNKKKKTLNNINLKINPGENIALVGESGAGKTTFTELILGYYKPSNGKIFLDGVNIQKLKLQWLRKQIAVVSQEISLFNDTLIKNLKYANFKASFDDIVEATKAANAHEFIMSLPKKYKTLIGERGVRLSVGQKQRIAITMAFLRNPKILILDEPTSALDAKSEKKVQEGIKRLIANRTTIIIAHRLSITRDVNKIVVLHKGEIVEVGNHKELMEKQGKYYELHVLQRGID